MSEQIPEYYSDVFYLRTYPWDLTPRVNRGRRPVVKYCELLLKRIENHIDTIVNSLP